MNTSTFLKLCGLLFFVWAASLMSTTSTFTQTVLAAIPTTAVPAAEEAASPIQSVNKIRLLSPAAFSQVISPLPVQAELQLYHVKTVRLDLLDTNGEVLSRKVYSFRTCSSEEQTSAVPLILDIPMVACFQPQVEIKTSLAFLMDKGAQKGYLQVMSADEENRLRSLETVELQLLSYGKQVFPAASASQNSLKIITPADGAQINGGKLIVQGVASQTSSLPLRVFLTTDDGQVIGSRMVNINQLAAHATSSISASGDFTIDVPYRLNQPKAALLSVALYSEAFKGPFLLTSQEVMLNP